jgi:predicted nucleic acid-binding protein
MKQFAPLFQITLVVDANIVLKSILWTLRRREVPHARTEFVELLRSHTVIAIAPTYLAEEMGKKIPELSAMHGVPEIDMHEEWHSIRPMITFIDVGGPDDSFIDPKDAPYIKLQRQTGHLIHSNDRHIKRMGGQVVSPVVMTALRVHARHVAVEYTLKAGGVGSLVVTFETVRMIGHLTKATIKSAKKIPIKVWLVAIGLFVLAISQENVRDWIKNFVTSLPERSRQIANKLSDVVYDLSLSHQHAKESAQRALVAVQDAIEDSVPRK